MPRLSVVIVNYGSESILADCLRTLESSRRSGLVGVTVVDNASPGFDAKALLAEFPWIQLVVNTDNLGFAAANNIGIRRSAGEYILLLNPDTRVPNNALAAMLDYMNRNPMVGAATCRVNLANGSLDPACHRGFPTPWASLTYFLGLEALLPRSRLFGRYHMTWQPPSVPHEIDSPSGCFFLVRRSVIEQVGLLDETFFMYGEDLDWAKRIKEAGWRVMFNPAASITHLKGQASGIKDDCAPDNAVCRSDRERAFHAFYDAMRVFYRKHYQRRYWAPIGWGVMLAINLQERLKRRRLKV
jgi:GT2 family glycosyltransferase